MARPRLVARWLREAQARSARHLQPRRRDRARALVDHERGRGQEGSAGGDHPRKGFRAAEKARAAFSRPQGRQAALPPGREGLRQLRPGVRPLPVEVSRARQCGNARPRATRTIPAPAERNNVRTTPRRSARSRIAAPPRTAYCHGSVSARASAIADPTMAPMAAGPAPSRKARTLTSARNWSKRRAPSRTNANDGLNATIAASTPPTRPAAAKPTTATVCTTGPG